MKTDLVVTGYIFYNNKVLLIHHNKLNLWLPVGGHIEKDEVPDDALTREIKEETSLDVEIISNNNIKQEGNMKKILANPFHVNVHSVGDHDHCSFFYVCKALNTESMHINNELKNYKWLTREELLIDNSVPEDVKSIAIEAFNIMKFV